MENTEFAKIRHYLGKTQEELSHLLCVSHKATQSYEQGWRNIPVNIERQLLYILSLKRSKEGKIRYCWEIRKCPKSWKQKCITWEYKIRYFCWFINGTFCQGELQDNWNKKMLLCRQCKVYRMIIPSDD